MLLAACSGATQAPPKPPTGYDFPPLTAQVVDHAEILPAKDEQVLIAQSDALERKTGHQFVVVTVQDLGGHDIKDYGTKLGNYWHIGRKVYNDGVLLIVAPNERKVRIAVVLGLEKVLTDAEAAEIIRTDILPDFSKGRLPEGIRKGAASIVRQLTPA